MALRAHAAVAKDAVVLALCSAACWNSTSAAFYTDGDDNDGINVSHLGMPG